MIYTVYIICIIYIIYNICILTIVVSCWIDAPKCADEDGTTDINKFIKQLQLRQSRSNSLSFYSARLKKNRKLLMHKRWIKSWLFSSILPRRKITVCFDYNLNCSCYINLLISMVPSSSAHFGASIRKLTTIVSIYYIYNNVYIYYIYIYCSPWSRRSEVVP